ncbi:MAG: hypothetical protein HFE57_08270 [Firmicutes bacterium]|nr:hypothetical protein [Bacillota bacterium]
MKKNKKVSFSIHDQLLLKELYHIKEIKQEKVFVQVVCKLLWSAINAYKKSPQYKNDVNKFKIMKERKQELDDTDIEELGEKDKKIKGLITFVERYDK